MTAVKIVFWVMAFIVFYTYLGYGMILYLCVKIKEISHKKSVPERQESDFPEISLLIAAFNEENIIAEKMENCRKLIYPAGKLKILWVCDGSTDGTVKLLGNYPEVTVIFSKERKGKSAALNHGMESVTTPLTAFTDANTMLNSTAIIELVKPFISFENVGCVAGEKRISSVDGGSASATEGIYWKYESKLKEWDYRLNSAVGAAGELYAIRTSLFEKMPEDTLLDDFMLSMKIAMKGYRIAYCKEAYAVESASADMQNEGKRKVRIAAGGLQSISRLLPLLNIFKYGTLSWQYKSHRVLRWSITPFALFLLIPLNIFLLFSETLPLLYLILFILQSFYLYYYFRILNLKFIFYNFF